MRLLIDTSIVLVVILEQSKAEEAQTLQLLRSDPKISIIWVAGVEHLPQVVVRSQNRAHLAVVPWAWAPQ